MASEYTGGIDGIRPEGDYKLCHLSLASYSLPRLVSDETVFWRRGADQSLNRSAGHYFEYDPIKLETLQDLTMELRLGRRRDGDEDDE
jgi:hypothetical protein